jgi:hypothetical protein
MKFHTIAPRTSPRPETDIPRLEGLRLCLDSLADEAQSLDRRMLALIIRAARDAVALEQAHP